METEPANRDQTGRFVKGVSGNPSGRPKLPDEIRQLKEESLQKAIEVLHEVITDPDFVKKTNKTDLVRIVETAFDRFGLPKVTKSEHTGNDGSPLVVKWSTD